MGPDIKLEPGSTGNTLPTDESGDPAGHKQKQLSKDDKTNKRRCVSTACVACRRRKSKCDGNLPKCAACASVYLTECEYAPHTDHRRKGVYKKDGDNIKTRTSTLQILTQALLNYAEEDAVELLKQMRTTDNLEELAQIVDARSKGREPAPDSPIDEADFSELPKFDVELSGKMGDLFLDGCVKFIGGTSNLVWLNEGADGLSPLSSSIKTTIKPREDAITSWTTVTNNKDLILHFLNMYFCWHYPYFTTLSKKLFYRDFLTGVPSQYCSSILVNAMLALGCHFSSKPAARADPEDNATTGDHFFSEAKRLLYENEEFANARLCTVQALALMSVREAGCGRESKGWVYSGMSFRMASDLGLNVDVPAMNGSSQLSPEDVDARRITFWGCFLFDKCWSNYLGRQPQLLLALTNTKKFDVFPDEDSEMWSPYTDTGIVGATAQPARTRAVALQISKLAEISADLLVSFYQPVFLDRPMTKQAELRKLTDIHTRLEAWKTELPMELEARDGQLPSVLLMHMFFQLLYIHLYRPFLRYTKATSPLPAHVSPRKFCTQAASAISKLLRLYKRTHGLRQVINKVIYIAHSACTIHLLNLPDKNAVRDILHGVKQLEEVGDCWIAARRTLEIIRLCAERWKIGLPDEAAATLARSQSRWSATQSGSGPVSPDTLISLSQHISARPLQDILAQNMVAQSQQLVQEFANMQPDQLKPYMAMTASRQAQTQTQKQQQQQHQQQQQQTEVEAALENFYQSPFSVTGDVTPSSSRNLPSTRLTRDQQDAWNMLQARMASSAAHKPSHSLPMNLPNAQSLFGGIESLMQESQDWWYKDQNQLAQGFDNWNGPSSDWASMTGVQLGTDGVDHVTNAELEGLFATSMASTGHYDVLGRGSQQQNDVRSNVRTNSQSLQPHMQHLLYQNQNQNRDFRQQHKRQAQWDDDVL